MRPSAEALLSLKRHFVGALLEPSPCEIEALPEPTLLVAGRMLALRPDGVTVTSDADEGQVMSVWNLGAEPVTVSLEGPTRAVEAQWMGGGQTAVLSVDDRAELTLRAAAGSAAEPRNDRLRVRAVTLSGLGADLTVAVEVVRRRSKPAPFLESETGSSPEPTMHEESADVASGTWKRKPSIQVRFPVETVFIALLALLLVLAFLILVVN
jgi:hypothetical protein